MAVGGRGITVELDLAAIREFCESDPGIVNDGQAKAEQVTQEAKRLAPVSPHGSNGRPSGYLRSQIQWDAGHDGEGLYFDIASPAETPTGEPYGLFNEVGTSKMAGTPHLRPALDNIIGSG